MTLVLWEIRGVGIWAADRFRALVNRREGRSTDLEVGKFVTVDFNGVPWVTVPSGHTLPSLSKPSQRWEREKYIDGQFTCATILGSGFSSISLLANLAADAWLLALLKVPIALLRAICMCGGCMRQCVK